MGLAASGRSSCPLSSVLVGVRLAEATLRIMTLSPPTIRDTLLVSSTRSLEVSGTAEGPGVVEVLVDDVHVGSTTTVQRTAPDEAAWTWRLTLGRPLPDDGDGLVVSARMRGQRGASAYADGTDGDPNETSAPSSSYRVSTRGVPTPRPDGSDDPAAAAPPAPEAKKLAEHE